LESLKQYRDRNELAEAMREHFEGKGAPVNNSWEPPVVQRAAVPQAQAAPAPAAVAPVAQPADDIDSVMDDEFSAAISRISG
jgi:hypothetical protein